MRLLCRAHIEKANHQEGNVSGIVSPRESETDREEFNKNSMTMMLWWEWYKNKSLSNDSIKSEQASASCDEVSGWSSLSRWAEYCLAHYDLGFPTPQSPSPYPTLDAAPYQPSPSLSMQRSKKSVENQPSTTTATIMRRLGLTCIQWRVIKSKQRPNHWALPFPFSCTENNGYAVSWK